jgi:hypothetical protein
MIKNEVIMKEDFLKVVYQLLKRQFDGINKSSWIWIDLFSDEESGFAYFKEQIENDEDFACLKDDTYYLGEELGELAYDISSEVASKLRGNDFLHMCEQCMLER